MWPTMWPRYYGEAGGSVYQAWARTLAGLGAQQITRGLEAVRAGGYRYPPAPPEFRRLCAPQPQALGLPSEEEAFAAAQRRDWSAPVVYWAVQRYREAGGGDQADLRAMGEPDKTWQRVYAQLVREADDGATFELPASAGPPLPSRPTYVDNSMTAEQAREELFNRYGRRRQNADGPQKAESEQNDQGQ